MTKKYRKLSTSKSNYNSISEKLKKEKKITPEFEVMLGTLTIEEILGLRLELAGDATNNKFYGFKVFQHLPLMTREAVLLYAYLNCATQIEAAAHLGLQLRKYYEMLDTYGIIEKAKNKLKEEKNE